MNAAELHEVLSMYADHVRRFEEIASATRSPFKPDPGAEVVPIQRYRDLEHEPTRRELEVLRLIAEGLTSGEIGTRLYLSDETVRSHVRGIFAALRVNSRALAVAVGQISPDVASSEPHEHAATASADGLIQMRWL